MSRFDVIALDADDTLWHNERLYTDAKNRFKDLLARYHDPDWIEARLDETERQNIRHFGYGIKSFALSMIETAVDLTEGRITGVDIGVIVTIAKEMISADVLLLEHAGETVKQLAASYDLMLVTKGDLLDQEMKVERSGLGPFFQFVEVVSEKSPEAYARLLKRHHVQPERFLMVGNSLRSDVLPVLEIGASAVYVPYSSTWAHEFAVLPAEDTPGFYQIEHLGLLPGLMQQIEQS